MQQEQESQELIILDEGAICSCRGLCKNNKAKATGTAKANAKAKQKQTQKQKAKAKVKTKVKRKSKSKRTRKRKSTSKSRKVNVQQGRTGDPTHQPQQDDRERPCRAGILQVGPPPNLAPASLAQPQAGPPPNLAPASLAQPQTQLVFWRTTTGFSLVWDGAPPAMERAVTCDSLNSSLCACTQVL